METNKNGNKIKYRQCLRDGGAIKLSIQLSAYTEVEQRERGVE